MKRIKIDVQSHFAGNYRIEYDGKYITLFGGDMEYPSMWVDGDFEEMVLIPIVAELRNVNPVISEVTQNHIIITL